MTKAKELEEEKRKLWISVYVAYVGSATIREGGASKWADIAVERFTERFITEKKKI